jgi:hypothetical protein
MYDPNSVMLGSRETDICSAGEEMFFLCSQNPSAPLNEPAEAIPHPRLFNKDLS